MKVTRRGFFGALAAAAASRALPAPVAAPFTITKIEIAASALAGTSPSYKIGIQGVGSTFEQMSELGRKFGEAARRYEERIVLEVLTR